MTPTFRSFRLLAALLLGLPLPLLAQDHHFVARSDAPTSEHEMRVQVDYAIDDESPSGPVTFLGVSTTPASPTLAAQLGLARGFGLVVMRVVPESGAVGVLEQHDILTKFDDQRLVSADQLGALVRAQTAGDKVTLTYLRAGRETTAEVELGEREITRPRVFEFRSSNLTGPSLPPRLAARTDAIRQGGVMPPMDFRRADVDTFLHELKDGEAGFRWFGRTGGSEAGPHMIALNHGNVTFSDDEGVVELRSEEGVTALLVKDPQGNVMFEGPVDTEEQRKGLAAPIRGRFEKVHDLRAIEFQTPEGFSEPQVHILPAGPETVRFSVPAERVGAAPAGAAL